MTAQATFLTPTYINDLERFTLLRESMERCQVDIPHVAVVQHEDLDTFKKIPFQHKLTLLSTRDVLPTDIETRRTAKGYPRRHPAYWINPRPLHGWMTQQLVKISSPDFVDSEGVICIDSDVFFVRNISAEDFFSIQGKLHFYDKPSAATVETVLWQADSMKALGVSVRGKVGCFIHNPTPIHREVVIEMRAALERIHSMRWMDVFLKYHLTEYTTYGVFARDVHMLKKLQSIEPPYALHCWVPEDVADIENTLAPQIAASDYRFVLMNSNLGKSVSDYRHLVEQAWLAANHASDGAVASRKPEAI